MAPLGEAGVVQDLLDVVEGEAAKDGQTTVQPDVLSEGECADRGGGDDEGSEAGGGDDGGTGEEGTADVEVLLLLSSGTDHGESAHHGDSVETGAAEERGRNEGEEGSDKGSLGGVESCPHGVLGDVAVVTKVSIRILPYHIWWDRKTHLSGLMDRVPIMVAKLSARPPIPTTQGFVTIKRYTKPV